MKVKLVCTGILAIAASFGTMAQETGYNVTDPTASCIDALAGQPGLKLIADKVQGFNAPARIATTQERAAVASLVTMRKSCFDQGSRYRQAVSTPQEFDFARNAFAYQQSLLSDLQEGRITFAQYSQRRLKMVAVSDAGI